MPNELEDQLIERYIATTPDPSSIAAQLAVARSKVGLIRKQVPRRHGEHILDVIGQEKGAGYPVMAALGFPAALGAKLYDVLMDRAKPIVQQGDIPLPMETNLDPRIIERLFGK